MNSLKTKASTICLLIAFSFLTPKDVHAKPRYHNFLSEKILYVIEYNGIDGIKIKSDSNKRPELTRLFKNGDKARWYLTEDELKSITYFIDDPENRKWYRLEKSKTGDTWITLSLKPSFRYDIIEFVSSTKLLSCTITSNDTKFLNYNNEELPPYPPIDNWANTKEILFDQNLFILAREDVDSNNINLNIELPWGFESKTGEKLWTLNLSTLPNKVNQIHLDVNRLAIIPLIYINYSETFLSSSIRRIHNALKKIDGKVFISLGHDGQLTFIEEIFSSKPESWNRFNQYVNRHPTIGYASIPRNEINHFAKRIDKIEYGFWDNQIALPILIFPGKNFQKHGTDEISQWIHSIDPLAKNRLIKKELIIIIIDDFDNLGEDIIQIQNYTIHKLSWSSGEINQKFTQLLRKLSMGIVL